MECDSTVYISLFATQQQQQLITGPLKSTTSCQPCCAWQAGTIYHPSLPINRRSDILRIADWLIYEWGGCIPAVRPAAVTSVFCREQLMGQREHSPGAGLSSTGRLHGQVVLTCWYTHLLSCSLDHCCWLKTELNGKHAMKNRAETLNFSLKMVCTSL